jgi:D-lactate dehydrogenase (cytochrome)
MLIGKRGHPFVPFEGMDLLDLFIGSEGMLGVIEQIELRLIEIPKNRWGIFSFFMDFDSTLSFAERMIAFDHANPRVVSVLEFCDQRSISYAQSFIKESSGLQKLPEIPKNSCASIYMELIFEEEAFQNDILIQVLDMLEECGVREEATWAGSEDQEIVLFRDFRHAIPEAINARIGENRLRDQTLHKLSSDFSVPQVCISDLAHMYRQDIEKSGVDAAMFGHVFESHLHINFIPKDAHEKQIAESLLKKWSVYVAETGGTIINEHGVGKLKKEIAKTGLPHETLLAMIQIKRAFDPDGFLNPTNMFDDNIMNI